MMNGLLESRDYTELRHFIDSIGVAAFVIDVEDDDIFRVAAINQRNEQLTGMRHSEIAGRRLEEFLPPEVAQRVKEHYRRCVRMQTAIDYQESIKLPGGTSYWRTTLIPYMDANGRVFRMLGTSFEISRTVHLELELRYQSTLLSTYLEESPDGILVVDADNNMKTWNHRFLEIWDIPEAIMQAGNGIAALEVVRRQLDEPDEFVDRVMDLYKHLDQEESGYRFSMKDGRIIERYSRGLLDPEGKYWGRIWFYRDVTEHERMTDELQRLAWTDTLTNTENRRAFMETLAVEFQRSRRYHHPMALLMLDLDNFKAVNDRYGHEGGDTALKKFAETIQALLRDSDHLGRVGGEEFAILLPETEMTEARQIAERLVRATADIAINSLRGTFGITISIGVTEIHPDDADVDHVLSRADQALYAAKADGRNRVASA
jgi:diguanylate cyclase (GGDEF)-like protein/PAS domain S-box-containing protein